MTDIASARTAALMATVTAGGLTETALLVKGNGLNFKVAFGAAGMGVILLALAEVNPALVTKFSALVILTALITSGGIVAPAVVKYLNQSPGKAPLA